jgi:hypothetical protein
LTIVAAAHQRRADAAAEAQVEQALERAAEQARAKMQRAEQRAAVVEGKRQRALAERREHQEQLLAAEAAHVRRFDEQVAKHRAAEEARERELRGAGQSKVQRQER